MTSFLELVGDECDNLTFMNYEIGSFKIRKNSRILGNFKIRKIRILDPWLPVRQRVIFKTAVLVLKYAHFRAVCRNKFRMGFTEMIEAPNAPISRRQRHPKCEDWRGCPLSSWLEGLGWGSVVSSQPGPGRSPARPQTPFQHFSSVAERFRWKENAILPLHIITDKVENFPNGVEIF